MVIQRWKRQKKRNKKSLNQFQFQHQEESINLKSKKVH